MTEEPTNNTEASKLEKEVFNSFKSLLANSINNYCEQKEYSLKEAAKSLGYPRATLGNWRTRKIPGWDNYFILMLKLEYEAENNIVIAKRAKKLCSNLADFVSKSIKTYCESYDVLLKDFAKYAKMSESSMRNCANSKNSNPPEYRQFFKILSQIYQGENAENNILKPVTDLKLLEDKGYGTIIEEIYSTEHEKNVKRKFNEKQLQELEDIKHFFEEGGKNYLNKYGNENLSELIEAVEEYVPESVVDRALLFEYLLQKIGEHVSHFRNSPVESRELLRSICRDKLQKIGSTTLEARQLLRKEDNYQNFLEMNQLKPRDNSGGEKNE